ncbi:MAG: phage tail family protein [Oscillospiraceae bacterium]|jgi:hypothetical protein|nr:phage tail family protein [Oscillospiraceae bacterium]
MLLEYINARGKTLLFAAPDGMEHTPYYLTGLQGAYGLDVDIQSAEQYPRDGETYIGSRVKPRSITLEGFIHGDDKAADRIRLLETLVPKEIGALTASRGQFKRRIACVIERAPYFKTSRGDKFSILLRCPDPYWTDAGGALSVELNGWEGLLEFELEIPDEDDPSNVGEDAIAGFEFGTRGNASLANALNTGQLTTGFTAVLSAIGTVVNPSLLNIRTRDELRFLLTMYSGDTITVSTSEYDKWALLRRADGSVENAMKYIDPAFVFFALEPGDNICRAGADEGGDLLNAGIEFKPRYLGL